MAHKQKLRSFHLFAGAGGGILADLILGHEVIGACEIEKYPRDVLLARQRDGILPAFPVWDDVCTLDGNPWRGAVDILCGGFPCQDISSAGKGAGITGERSGLWKEYARLIGEMRPRFVFAENSPLLRTRGLGVVLEDLASLGYNARWGIIGAGAVGAPHKRDRMWVLAYAKGGEDERRERRILDEAKRSGKGCDSTADACGQDEELAECGGSWWGFDPADICNTSSEGLSERPEKQMGESGSVEEFERSIGDSEDGAVESGLGRMVDGLADFVDFTGTTFTKGVPRVAHGIDNRVNRLKAIGNGQVSLCAAMAFSILSEGLI
jgi:DNA (cytosine-5)-methyltransferase 1